VRRLCDPADARRLLNPGPLAIVTTSWRAMANAAPVAWTVPLSMAPPLVGIAVHPDRHTADMIRYSEEFALNIPGPALARQAAFLGSLSGRDTNKIEAAGIETFHGLRVESPLIVGCLAWIECSLQDVFTTGDHTFFTGRVEKVQALDEAYAGTWLLNDPHYSPLVYLGGTRYATLSGARDVTFAVDIQGRLVAETAEEREAREEAEARERELRKAEGDEGFEAMRVR